jgi:hypothetical protein
VLETLAAAGVQNVHDRQQVAKAAVKVALCGYTHSDSEGVDGDGVRQGGSTPAAAAAAYRCPASQQATAGSEGSTGQAEAEPTAEQEARVDADSFDDGDPVLELRLDSEMEGGQEGEDVGVGLGVAEGLLAAAAAAQGSTANCSAAVGTAEKQPAGSAAAPELQRGGMVGAASARGLDSAAAAAAATAAAAGGGGMQHLQCSREQRGTAMEWLGQSQPSRRPLTSDSEALAGTHQ